MNTAARRLSPLAVMAPNVKETASVVDSLASLNVKDLMHPAKFAPLTATATTPDAGSRVVAEKEQKQQELISNLLGDEENHFLFSAQHLEDNLRLQYHVKTDATQMETSTAISRSGDYWHMPEETKEKVPNQTVQQINYVEACRFKASQEKNELIATILKEERIRQSFSVHRLEQSPQSDARRHSGTDCTTVQYGDVKGDASYWMW